MAQDRTNTEHAAELLAALVDGVKKFISLLDDAEVAGLVDAARADDNTDTKTDHAQQVDDDEPDEAKFVRSLFGAK